MTLGTQLLYAGCACVAVGVLLLLYYVIGKRKFKGKQKLAETERQQRVGAIKDHMNLQHTNQFSETSTEFTSENQAETVYEEDETLHETDTIYSAETDYEADTIYQK